MEDFELCVSPVEAYKRLNIPTFENNNSSLLKKLPLRWQKNAKIAAGMGLIGAFALSGCVTVAGETQLNTEGVRPNKIEHNLQYTQGSYSGYSEADLLVRIHTGGGGASAYMVHLTEQEAFGIIRARLEAAGLVFDEKPPKETKLTFDEPKQTYYDEVDWYLRHTLDYVKLDLFDAQKEVGVAHVSWLGSSRSFMPDERMIARRIEEEFAEQTDDIIVGAFYNPGRGVGGTEWTDAGELKLIPPSNEEVEEARPILVRQLINQADKFILHLQSEGILERFPDITITINGTPLSLGEYPMIINNHKMVPAFELLKALGMDVAEDENEWRIAITGIKNDVDVRAQVGLKSYNQGGSISVSRDDNRKWPQDIPVILHDDIILIPLQFVADVAGATVEWDEDARTINITS